MATYKKPTAQDAELLIKLMQMGSRAENQAAMAWFSSDFKAKNYSEFKKKYPDGSPGDQYFGRLMAQLELEGVLVSHGLLNENLYFDMSGIGFMWERVGPIVAGMRKEMSSNLYENAVWLAERQKKWAKTVWKPNLVWKK
jgi:hypothetical protein